jgi:hypothetical protein
VVCPITPPLSKHNLLSLDLLIVRLFDHSHDPLCLFRHTASLFLVLLRFRSPHAPSKPVVHIIPIAILQLP